MIEVGCRVRHDSRREGVVVALSGNLAIVEMDEPTGLDRAPARPGRGWRTGVGGLTLIEPSSPLIAEIMVYLRKELC